MQLYQLTEEDVKLLRELHAERKNRRHSKPVVNVAMDDVPAQEVYLVRVPPEGIPAVDSGALTGTSATDLADDVFSGTDCYCYRLSETTGKAIPLNRRIKVHNRGDVAISGDRWATAAKDKWGRWWAQAEPISSISFTVVTDCSFDTGTCKFTKTTSTITITGSNLEVSVT